MAKRLRRAEGNGKRAIRSRTATPPSTVARRLADRIRKQLGVEREPFAFLGAGGAAIAALGLAELIGAGELLLAAAAAYSVYQMLSKNKRPAEAVEEGAQVGRGEPPRRAA